jgi:hypothetical protein
VQLQRKLSTSLGASALLCAASAVSKASSQLAR